MNEKIKNLQEQIEEEKRKILNCKHDFEKPIYDPESVSEPYGYKLVGHGSDIWSEAEGYRTVKKDRWSRKCKLCGFIEYTTKLKPIVIDHVPFF